jgi:hypothetical protein
VDSKTWCSWTAPHGQGKNLSAKMIEEVYNFLETWNTRIG